MKLIFGSKWAISSSSRGINQSLREQFVFPEHPPWHPTWSPSGSFATRNMDWCLVYVKYTKVIDDMQITNTTVIGGGWCMKFFTMKNKICTLTLQRQTCIWFWHLKKLCSCKDSKLMSSWVLNYLSIEHHQISTSNMQTMGLSNLVSLDCTCLWYQSRT